MPIDVPVPGGTATLILKRELTPRRQLPYKALLTQYQDLSVRIARARSVTLPDGRTETDPTQPGEPIVLSYEQAEFVNRLDYALIPTYLVSWTLDAPAPTSVEAALDLPVDVADALLAAIRLIAGGMEAWREYEPSEETLDNPDSPSGRSGDTATGSGASADGENSAEKSKTS
jgi:hypothetical protein